MVANPRRSVKAKDKTEEAPLDLESARRLVAAAEEDRDVRIQAFSREFEALCAKYNVELRTGITAVAL